MHDISSQGLKRSSEMRKVIAVALPLLLVACSRAPLSVGVFPAETGAGVWRDASGIVDATLGDAGDARVGDGSSPELDASVLDAARLDAATLLDGSQMRDALVDATEPDATDAADSGSLGEETGCGALVPQWIATFGGPGAQLVHGVAADTDGEVMIVGETSAENFPTSFFDEGSAESFVRKLDADGTLIWEQRLFNDSMKPGTVIANQVTFDRAGAVWVTGRFRGGLAIEGVISIDHSGPDAWAFAMRFDAHDGTLLYSATLPGRIAAIAADPLSIAPGIIVAGTFQGRIPCGNPNHGVSLCEPRGEQDIYIARVNPVEPVTAFAFGGTGGEFVSDVDVDSMGRVVAVGTAQGSVDFGGAAEPFDVGQYSHAWIATFSLDQNTQTSPSIQWARALDTAVCPVWHGSTGAAVTWSADSEHIIATGIAWGCLTLGAQAYTYPDSLADSYVARVDRADGRVLGSEQIGAINPTSLERGGSHAFRLSGPSATEGGRPSRPPIGIIDLLVNDLSAAGTRTASQRYGRAGTRIEYPKVANLPGSAAFIMAGGLVGTLDGPAGVTSDGFDALVLKLDCESR